MATVSFGVCTVISFATLLVMSLRRYENIDRYYWTIATLIPIINMAYWLKTMVVTEEAAAITFCFIYLDSTFMLTVIIFLMLRAIRVRVNVMVKAALYIVAFIHIVIVTLCVHNDLYYKKITVTRTAGGSVTKMDGGVLYVFHYVYLGLIFAAIIGILVAGFLRKGSYSLWSLRSCCLCTVICLVIYAVEGIIDIDFSLLPYLYTVAGFIVTVQYDRIHMHDIFWLSSEHQKNTQVRGYAAFDINGRFLSANERILDFWPLLKDQRVDEFLPDGSPLRTVFYSMVEAFESRGENSEKFQIGDMTCVCEVTPFSLSITNTVQGYFFDVRDATEEQEYLDIITGYNEKLNSEVKAKTDNIIEIQSRIVTGMANMIENRDLNTGGHVKRTSDIIRIVIEEVRRQKVHSISDEFATDVIRAAPMHDLGKISIENSILNKPAKLTDDEYEIMKTHASKSGEMVMILLEGVEEKHFVKVAYNVARFHHERWDGRGYPEGLSGTMIPVEARIMALADVYDALASRRSYKEAMDPNLVAKIMMEGMGTQFDPNLKPVFIGCREQLEAYYREANRQ